MPTQTTQTTQTIPQERMQITLLHTEGKKKGKKTVYKLSARQAELIRDCPMLTRASINERFRTNQGTMILRSLISLGAFATTGTANKHPRYQRTDLGKVLAEKINERLEQ